MLVSIKVAHEIEIFEDAFEATSTGQFLACLTERRLSPFEVLEQLLPSAVHFMGVLFYKRLVIFVRKDAGGWLAR